MINRLLEYSRGGFRPPIFADNEEKTRQALVLNRLISVTFIALICLTAIGLPFLFHRKVVSALFLGLLFIIILLARKLMHRGLIRPASRFIVSTLWCISAALILLGSGFRDGNIVMLVSVIVTTGLLLGRRAAMIVTAITVLTTLSMAVLEGLGYLPLRYFPLNLSVSWFQITFAIVLITATMNIALTSLEDSLHLAHQRLSERQQVEKALQASEERYRNFFEKAVEGIYQITPEGCFLDVNPAMAHIFGYDLTTEMLEDNYAIRARHYVAPERRQVLMDKLAENGFLIGYEQEMVRKDGRKIWVSINAREVRDDQGRLLSYEGSLVDITTRKLAEEALREKQTRIQEAYRLARLGAWSWIKATNVLEWSEGMYEIFGLDRTLPPPPVDEHVHMYAPGHWKRRFKANRQILETGVPQQMEVEIINADGSRHWLNTYCGPQYNSAGEIIGLNGTVQDITDRKRAEEALRDSEARYRLLADNARDLIWTMDMNLQFTYLSPYTQHLVGYSPEECIQMPLHELLTPDSLERVTGLLIQEMEIEKRADKDISRSNIFEIDEIHRNGHLVPCEVKTAFLRDAAGQAIGILGVTRDITERQRVEAERKKWEEQLIQAQKLESIGTLAGGIAHDFNNLLMGIQGYTSLMLLDMDAGHPYYESLRNIERQVHSGANLTKQLLGYARGGKYEVQPTDMNRFLDQNSRLFGRTRKEIVIVHAFENHLRQVAIDRNQMDQVFLNLYINAWHAMPAGGELTLETKNVSLNADHAKSLDIAPGQYVKISVRDSGVGMDEKTRIRIFDPFFTTKEMGRGSGLGLASAYGILRNHGGMITVDSVKGLGTTFHVYLPASEAAVIPEEQKRQATIEKGQETILFVDDEEMNLNVAGMMLKNLGYTVLLASSGQEALDIYLRQQENIHLVILDMIMPGMSGGDLFDALQTINPHVGIILASGYSLEGRAQEIMDRGAKAFLQKPFSMEELSSKIRTALEGRFN